MLGPSTYEHHFQKSWIYNRRRIKTGHSQNSIIEALVGASNLALCVRSICLRRGAHCADIITEIVVEILDPPLMRLE